MTDNMFDKFVRDKLADHQSPVPQGLWDKIERKKDKDPKGGFFLPKTMLWAGLFMIVTGIGVGYYVSGNNDNDQPATQLPGSAAANNGGKTGTTQSPDAGNGDGITNNATQTITPNSSNTNTTTVTNSTETITASENDLPANVSVDQPKQNTVATYDHPNPVTGKEIKFQPALTGKRDAQKNAGKTNIASNKNQGEFIYPDFTTGKSLDLIPTVKQEDMYRIALTAGKTAYNLRGLASFNTNKNLDLSGFRIVSIDCPPNGTMRRNDWYLELFGSPDLVMKSVKANGNASFVSKKDSTESQQLSYTAGFRISKSIGEHLLLKTGLQFSQINERFDLRTENERRIITVVTIRTVTGSSGADSTISDTSTVEQIGYRLQRTYNRYRSIDIPILLSYEFGNDNLKFAVNAGAIVNLYSWYTGNTINDSLNVVSMNSKNSGVYKQNIGVGLYGGFSIIKPVSNKFDIFLEPYFRYNLTNMSRSAGYSQRFNAAGLNFGIRYKLKGQRTGSN